jgi:hypothetical protein
VRQDLPVGGDVTETDGMFINPNGCTEPANESAT